MTKLFKGLNTVHKLDNYYILITTDAPINKQITKYSLKHALINRFHISLLYKALNTKSYNNL